MDFRKPCSWLGPNQPALTYPPKKKQHKAFLRAYQPLVSLKRALLNPYFWRGGGTSGAGWLIRHGPSAARLLLQLLGISCALRSKMLHSLHHIVTVHHLGDHHVFAKRHAKKKNSGPASFHACKKKKKQKKMDGFKNPKTKKFTQKSKREKHLNHPPPWLWLSKLAKNARKNLSRDPRLEGDGHDSVSAPVAESHLNRCQSSLQKHGRKIVGLEDPGTDPGGSWPPFKKGTFRRVFDFVAVDLGWHSNNVFFLFFVWCFSFSKGKDFSGSGGIRVFFAKGWFKSKGRISYSNSICYVILFDLKYPLFSTIHILPYTYETLSINWIFGKHPMQTTTILMWDGVRWMKFTQIQWHAACWWNVEVFQIWGKIRRVLPPPSNGTEAKVI